MSSLSVGFSLLHALTSPSTRARVAIFAAIGASATACVQKTSGEDLTKTKVDRVFVSTNLSTCAKSDRAEFYCWGDNRFGQLSVLTEEWTAKPLAMETELSFDSLALGDEHSCGVTVDSELYCWGSNENSRLGIGRPDNVIDPTLVDLSDVAQVATNSRHTCAVTNDEDLYCWGLNDRGSLGIDVADGKQEASPKKVKLTQVKQVALGPDFTCAIVKSGELYCWGNSDDGRLGIGEKPEKPGDQKTPTKVTIPSVKQVSLGDSYGCAVTKANEVYCWGSNKKGQLGIPKEKTVLAPTKVEKLAKIVQVAAGQDPARPHVCSLGADGRVYCAGAGDAAGGTNTDTPVRVPNVTGVSEIGAGKARTCAVTERWGLYCWGATAVYDEVAPKPEWVIGPK